MHNSHEIDFLKQAHKLLVLSNLSQRQQDKFYWSSDKVKLVGLADFLKLPEIPSQPIQNPDGTFLFMLDYDPLT